MNQSTIGEYAVGTGYLIEVGPGLVEGGVTDAVVTGLTERCTEFEHVEPVFTGSHHEVFFSEVPTCGERPEGTPTVTGSEARRTVATDRTHQVVAIHQGVFALEEYAAVREFAVSAVAFLVVDSVVHEGNGGLVEVVTDTFNVFGTDVFGFVTKQSSDGVDFVEGDGVVSQALERGNHAAVSHLHYLTAVGAELTVEAVGEGVSASVVNEVVYFLSKGEAFDGGEDSVPLGIDDVVEVVVHIVHQLANRVALGHTSSTYHAVTVVDTVTIVVDGVAVEFVVHDRTVGVAHVHRINGGELVDEVESVARGSA